MDALERAALKEQRKRRRQWKRLNLPSYIEKVEKYKQRCKDKAQLQKNIDIQANILKSIHCKYGIEPVTLSCDTTIGKASIPFSDQIILNVLFSESDFYNLSEDQLSDLFEDLRRWSYTPFLPGYDLADTVFSRFWQLAQEYGIEYGPYDQESAKDVLAYYEHTKHYTRPSSTVPVTISRERHPDCDPEFCSDLVPCDLCQELIYEVSVPIKLESDSDEDVFLDCLDDLDDPIEQDFALHSVKIEPEQALILAGSKLSMPEGREHHISDKTTLIKRQALIHFEAISISDSPQRAINLYVMRYLRRFATRHRFSASRYLLHYVNSCISRRPSGLWKVHPPETAKQSSI